MGAADTSPGRMIIPTPRSRIAACIAIVIGGHGAVGGKADLVLFRDVLVEIRDKVATLKKQGRSLADIVASKPGARYDAEWGNGFIDGNWFVGLVYQGV
jgi:hypothetical protein